MIINWNSKMNSLLDRGSPILRLHWDDIGHQLNGRLQYSNREVHTVSFTEFVPRVVFHVAAERVLDVNQLALDSCCKSIQHDSLVGMSMGMMRFMFVLSRDRDLVFALDLGFRGTSSSFEKSHVSR
jgi:hypothetical protein